MAIRGDEDEPLRLHINIAHLAGLLFAEKIEVGFFENVHISFAGWRQDDILRLKYDLALAFFHAANFEELVAGGGTELDDPFRLGGRRGGGGPGAPGERREAGRGREPGRARK